MLSATANGTNLFAPQEFASETSLYYYRARYYDPTTGRFIREDPVSFMGGINFYTYVSISHPTGATRLGKMSSSAVVQSRFPSPATRHIRSCTPPTPAVAGDLQRKTTLAVAWPPH